MSPTKAAVTPTEIYDQALKYSRDFRVPPGVSQPAYTSTWLPENIAVLERYVEWLNGGGTSWQVTRTYHIPMAGHVLSLNHKPSGQLDLEHDLAIAMIYILAKQLGACWNKICRNALAKFRRFLLHERGQVERKTTPFDPIPHTAGLPAWLVEQLTRLQRIQQRNWREARIEENIQRFWSGHLRLWRFLCERFGVRELADLKRAYFMDYIDHRLAGGASVRGVNGDLRSFHGFLAFLQEQGIAVPVALLRLRCLKEPEPLPRFLSDAQVSALRDDFEQQVVLADNPARRRGALLDRAWFYLLWQAGLRRGEVEDLRLEDLDLEGRRLTVRRGKGLLDRTVYLTDTVVSAQRAYLAVRGPGPTGHVFLYRNQALSKDFIHGRLKASGARVSVPVFAHKLRHTCATQLLNAGCPITSIQKFLGHKRLNTTLTYARAHDQTVAEDYFTAMARVEQRLDAPPIQVVASQPLPVGKRKELLALAEQMAEPELSLEKRLGLVLLMRGLLFGKEFTLEEGLQNEDGREQQEHPPPSPKILWAIAA